MHEQRKGVEAFLSCNVITPHPPRRMNCHAYITFLQLALDPMALRVANANTRRRRHGAYPLESRLQTDVTLPISSLEASAE